MTLHQLRIFECVARDLNITQASAELHLSQPTVSQQLKLLEEECGVNFLLRKNHGVALTLEGRAFVDAIRPVLAGLDDIGRRFRGNQNKKLGQCLAIGGSRIISTRVLPNLVKSFREQHPSVEFTLTANDSSVIERLLLKSELDLAVIASPSYIEGLIYEPFDDTEVVAVCLPSSPVAGRTLTLEELAEYPLLVRSPSRLKTVLTSQGYRMNFAVQCDASHPVKVAVRAGLGIGITYRNAIANSLAKGSLKLINVPEFKKMAMKSMIAYDGRKSLSSIAQEFLALLRERAKRVQKIDRPVTAITPLNGRDRKLSKRQHVFAKTARKYPLSI
jgi:DNA-binding transcriptional LysR family regulator